VAAAGAIHAAAGGVPDVAPDMAMTGGVDAVATGVGRVVLDANCRLLSSIPTYR
jgi:hypothetical protein